MKNKNKFPARWHVCVGAFILPVAMSHAEQQSDSAGVVEGSHLKLLSRNYYWHQTGDAGKQKDWTQGEMLDFTSGFTQGVVGFGLDAFAYGAAKLDGGSGQVGSMTLPFRDDGDPADSYSKAGGSVKLRLSSTTLRYGDLQPQVPVFATGNYYQLNQTATGWMLDSAELSGLTLGGGHFTSGTGYISTNRDGDLGLAYAGKSTSQIDYAGGAYSFNDQLSVMLYAAQFKDLMNQYYSNVNYILPLSDTQAFTFDFNIYRSVDSGHAEAGDINLTAASLSAAFSTGPHKFLLAIQRNDGDQPQDYAAIGSTRPGVAAGVYSGGIYLANATEISDFNAPNERSVQVRYDLDMSTFGVPGAKFTLKHLRGYDIDGTNLSEDSAYFGLYGKSEKEHETNIIAEYVVQSGPAKDLSAKVFQSWHSGAPSTGGSITQTRFSLSYPLEIF
ncbi:OprD family outer membrane porin [Pseudomonas sp. Lb2C1-1]|uniref:OprD family outer membrane porin n=1 Tax=Pseudomonas TaxID=286 RepID=UPI00391BD0A4